MNARILIALTTLALTLTTQRGHAGQCEDWRVGPLVNSYANNGASSTVQCATSWDPDGAGPAQPVLVVGGAFTTMEGVTVNRIGVRDANGLWHSLDGGVTAGGAVRALAVYNGALIAGGFFTSIGGQTVNYIARWNGSTWQPLGSGFDGGVDDLTVFNGQLIAGGSFTFSGSAYVSRIAAWNGSVWLPLGNGLGYTGDPSSAWVSALAVHNGSLYIGGQFNVASGLSVNGLVRWTGSTYQTVGDWVGGWVHSLAVYNNQLIAAGWISNVPSGFANHIVRLVGSTWQPLGGGLQGSSPMVHALTVYNGELIVGGNFVTAGGHVIPNIARWNGSDWWALGVGTDSGIFALGVYNNELIAGGYFSQAGGYPASGIARWNGTLWSSFGGGSVDGILAFTTYGTRIVAGGNLRQPTGPQPTAHAIVAFDGVTRSAFGTGMNDAVNALCSFINPALNNNNELVAGGWFTIAGGLAANRIARWREHIGGSPPPAWEPMGPGFNNAVMAVERFNNNTIAGGIFTQSGTAARNYIASWDESSQTWLPIGTGMNISGVFALKVYNGQLYAGGAFTVAGGVATGGIARWNGLSWQRVGNLNFPGQVYALEVHNGELVIGGFFPSITGSTNIIKYNSSTNQFSSLGTGIGPALSAVVRSLKSSNGKLYVGGAAMTTAGGVPAQNIAVWNGSSWAELQGGADGSVYALGLYHNEIQVGGFFNTVRSGAITTRGWARFFQDGVPWIAYQPSSTSVACNQHAVFYAVPALQYGGLGFVWRKNGVPLNNGPTGTGSHILNLARHLEILYPSEADEGVYDLVLSSDGCGTVTTIPATLDVVGTCPPCPADATHDRFINVDDLIAVILNWGPCPAQPAQYAYYPPCTADVTGDLQVSVDDLILVILSWGSCP